MEKKILLAIDDSRNSRQAVSYAGELAASLKNISYTLFHIQPAISQFLTDEAKSSFKAQTALLKMKKKNADASLTMLEKCKEMMCEKGMDEKCIELKTVARKIGLAKDIIDYAQEKRFDAVLAGSRGLTRMQEIFMGSVTKKLVEHSRVIPLWIVDGNVVSSEKILVAVDGSESALRAVDHLSFIIGENPDIRITLFHVVPMFRQYCPIDFDESDDDMQYIISQGDKKCIEKFFVHAFKRFSDAGISREHIRIKEEKRQNIGRAIVEEARKEGYGTVVIGRRGQDSAFFMGSVSAYVIDKISDCAVWLVP